MPANPLHVKKGPFGFFNIHSVAKDRKTKVTLLFNSNKMTKITLQVLQKFQGAKMTIEKNYSAIRIEKIQTVL